MNRPTRACALTLLLSLAAVPAGAGPGGGLTWRAWDPGLREARASRRPVLVDVYTEWCGWCRRMDRDVYSRPEVKGYLDRAFVTVKLDAEAGDRAEYEGRTFTSRSLATRFRVSGYPTTIFLRPDGDHLVSVPGYIEPERFLVLLHYIADGAYDRGVSFPDYVKQVAGSTPPAR